MAFDTFIVIANQYEKEADAVADFHDVRKLYTDLGIIDTYDAAVISRDTQGKVHIVEKVEEPTRQLAGAGAVAGLAVGAVVALFPAVALGAGLLVGGGLGAGLGAIAGHVTMGMSRDDLKQLGELLDEGTSGLVVVAATDLESRVDEAIKRSQKQVKTELKSDSSKLEPGSG
jgi:uncharacterized membrane protein